MSTDIQQIIGDFYSPHHIYKTYSKPTLSEDTRASLDVLELVKKEKNKLFKPTHTLNSQIHQYFENLELKGNVFQKVYKKIDFHKHRGSVDSIYTIKKSDNMDNAGRIMLKCDTLLRKQKYQNKILSHKIG